MEVKDGLLLSALSLEGRWWPEPQPSEAPCLYLVAHGNYASGCSLGLSFRDFASTYRGASNPTCNPCNRTYVGNAREELYAQLEYQ